MPTTEDELQAKRENVAQLRDQLAQENAKRVQREQDDSRDVEAARLDAEATRLQQQLEAAQRENSEENYSAPVASTTQDAKTAMQAAAAGSEVTQGPAAANDTSGTPSTATATPAEPKHADTAASTDKKGSN